MLFEKEEYSPAIRLYNEAIKRYNTSPVLYGNRAAAYMKRDWSVANIFFLLLLYCKNAQKYQIQIKLQN